MIPSIPSIKTILQNGDLDSAAQQLLTFAQVQAPRFVNEIIGHVARLKQIATDERKGVVSVDVTMTRKNQVMYALLDLMDVMEEAGKASAVAGAESVGGNSVVIGGNVSNSVIILGDGNSVKQKKDDEGKAVR